jgi:hypothetical protein
MVTARVASAGWSVRTLNVATAVETVAAFTESGRAAHRAGRRAAARRIGGAPI